LVLGFAAWVVGVVLVLLSITSGQLRLHRFSRRTQAVRDAAWMTLLKEACETLQLRRVLTLLQPAENLMPLTWGWWRPVVLLPAEADNWPLERRRIVLLHELAHVKRWDCLTQLAANIVCALFWFNPLVWLAARRMCVERERARACVRRFGFEQRLQGFGIRRSSGEYRPKFSAHPPGRGNCDGASIGIGAAG